MHFSAERGLAIACRPSVTLVDCDHIGWKSWKLIAQTISPMSSLFVAKGDPPTPREHGKFLGRLEAGQGKSGVLENKSGNISETRKDRGKVTMDGLQELTNALSNGTIPDTLWSPLPRDWGFATQLPLVYQEQVKLRTLNLPDKFTAPIRMKAH